MVFGNCGVLAAETLSDRKGYVEMTGIDDSTSQDISDAIVSKGGRYLEAQVIRVDSDGDSSFSFTNIEK